MLVADYMHQCLWFLLASGTNISLGCTPSLASRHNIDLAVNKFGDAADTKTIVFEVLG